MKVFLISHSRYETAKILFMSEKVKSNLGILIRHEIAFICSENMVKDYSELVK